MKKAVVLILTVLAPVRSPHAAADGFDYPFGPPDGTPRCFGSAQCANGWQNVQGFRLNNHLGEDWNFGFGSDDLGKPIFAAADGEVVYAQDVGGDGSWRGVIIVLHTGIGFSVPSGGTVPQVKTMYAHLDPARINEWVTLGAQVARGQQIGVIGPTPVGSTGPHLHFEVRTNTSIGVGPGYSNNATGWVSPSDFVQANRPGQSTLTAVPVNGGWQVYFYPKVTSDSAAGLLATNGPFVVTSSNWVRVDVTDWTLTGDWYTIFGGTKTNGPVLLVTPDVPFDTAPMTTNLDVAFADARFSHGTFLLPPGTNTFTVRQEDMLLGYNGWTLGLRAVGQPYAVIQRAIEISWASTSNAVYQVQWASRGETNTWFNLGAPVVAKSTMSSVRDPVDQTSRFYRILLLP